MRKIFTSDKTLEIKESVKNQGPKESTLEFLKQFARFYSYEPKLEGKLGNLLAN